MRSELVSCSKHNCSSTHTRARIGKSLSYLQLNLYRSHIGLFPELFLPFRCQLPILSCPRNPLSSIGSKHRMSKHRFMISRNTNHQHITAYWIAFGPHGPRALPPPGEGKKVFFYTAIGVGVSFALFAFIRMFAGPEPHTMTKEWQEASNEYLKVRPCPLSPSVVSAMAPPFSLSFGSIANRSIPPL